jgi:hypothetical protein
MNPKGNPVSLVAAHPGNLNALKSGAHSPRLIEARAAEIMSEFAGVEELDDEGRVALRELARLEALIEAIDHDLDARGVTDREGKERYLLQRRERYSRQLMETMERVGRARVRARRHSAPDGVVGERRDYVRQLQAIALGHEREASVSERIAALKLLLALESRGTTSYFEQPPADPTPAVERDDLVHAARVAELEARLAEARKAGELTRLLLQISFAELGY